MRQINSILKFGIVCTVLTVAFAVSVLLSIFISVNLSVPVQNSNRKLDGWVTTLQGMGYSVYYADYFNPTSSLIKADNINEFTTMLRDHKVTEAHWHWTELGFPTYVVYGKIWFISEENTYYMETSW